MGDEGLETPANPTANCSVSQTGGAESGAVAARDAKFSQPKPFVADSPKDENFSRLVKAWPSLPEHIRAAITALVVSATSPTVPIGL
jgi:hypothetical protein